MTDAEWAEVRSAMPVPAWLLKQGGRPEAYCHREILDAVRYLVDNGVKWMALPVDFPYFLWNQRCQVGGMGAVSGIGLDGVRVCL